MTNNVVINLKNKIIGIKNKPPLNIIIEERKEINKVNTIKNL